MEKRIEVVRTPTMLYLVVNSKIEFQIIPSQRNLLDLRSEAFTWCLYYGKCIAMEWRFEGTKEELEIKLKEKK